MKIGERDIELAERRASQERDAAIRRAQAALTGEGSRMCRSCGDPIPRARRAALPSATTCIDCASEVS
ncbi:MAG: molecular chaperone DnaK [Rhodobacteraceae bacterium]|nr:molecular chaperone DnaK [Paracoccaceae bacterium]